MKSSWRLACPERSNSYLPSIDKESHAFLQFRIGKKLTWMQVVEAGVIGKARELAISVPEAMGNEDP
jgi:hypothetical protein